MLRRLDAELVRRKLARSREHAQTLIAEGHVRVNRTAADKPARQVSESDSITIADRDVESWVSRGAHKLIGAFDAFAANGFKVVDKSVLDAGASTGGFTQVCLRRGAENVIALDVGYGQLAWEVRTDPRVSVVERFNVRNLTREDLDRDVNVVVADLSFISLVTVLPALVRSIGTAADYVLMVKPQFEVGKEHIGEGVVHDSELRFATVLKVVAAAGELGLDLQGCVASPLPGPEGNVEYFVWLTGASRKPDREECEQMIRTAVEEGPK